MTAEERAVARFNAEREQADLAALRVTCPKCYQAAGQPCLDRRHRPTDPHRHRHERAQVAKNHPFG